MAFQSPVEISEHTASSFWSPFSPVFICNATETVVTKPGTIRHYMPITNTSTLGRIPPVWWTNWQYTLFMPLSRALKTRVPIQDKYTFAPFAATR